jgi:pyruvate formate lyase activating enzyme
VEALPLFHFHPGSRVLWPGRSGRYPFRETRTHALSPAEIMRIVDRHGVKTVVFSDSRPWNIEATDRGLIEACHHRRIRTIALTAGAMPAEVRKGYFQGMQAVRVNLKAFTDAFYVQHTGAQLSPVLETLLHIYHETDGWLEITTCLMPGLNDHPVELDAMTQWLYKHLGHEIPLHFTLSQPGVAYGRSTPTAVSILKKARKIAEGNGLSHVYLDHPECPEGGHTHCECCGRILIRRGGGALWSMDLTERFECPDCGMKIKGKFLEPSSEIPRTGFAPEGRDSWALHPRPGYVGALDALPVDNGLST